MDRISTLMEIFASSKLAHTAVGSVFGSVVRVVLLPERNWQQWVARVFVGTSSAVFIGGGIAEMLNMGTWGFAMMGFIIGTSAEQVLAAVQRRVTMTISGPEERKEAPKDSGTP